MLNKLRTAGKTALYLVYLALASGALLELFCRWPWIDLYRNDFRALNPPEYLARSAQRTVLVFGDSYTATVPGYLNVLRDTFPQIRWVNNAVPGTGIKEALTMAARRRHRFRADAVLYQVYAGNDLPDIRRPVERSQDLGWRRYGYDALTNYLRFPKYLNYRAGQLAHPAAGPDPAKIERDTFRADAYNAREKRLLHTYPTALEDAVLLHHGADREARYLADGIRELIRCLDADSVPVVILLLPHCTQVSETYRARFRQMGAQLPQDSAFYQANYPLADFLAEQLRPYPQVTVLNPLGWMRQTEAGGQRLYYANDPHLSGEGQRLLAEWVRECLGDW